MALADKLRAEVADANALSRERERIIDRLLEENKRLRGEAIERFLEPTLRDLVRLSDELHKTVAAYAAGPPAAASVLADFRSYKDSVLDILYRQGVEPYDAAPGTLFDPKLHRALGSLPTGRAELDRTIARVVRVGFSGSARLLRPLEAEVYRLRAAGEPAETASAATIETQNVGALVSPVSEKTKVGS